MDHTIQTETEFLDTVETPHKTPISERIDAQNMALATEIMIQKATKEENANSPIAGITATPPLDMVEATDEQAQIVAETECSDAEALETVKIATVKQPIVELADVTAVDVVEISAEQVEAVEVMAEEATDVAAVNTVDVATVKRPMVELADVTAVDVVEINAEQPVEAVEVVDEATGVAALDTIEVVSVEQPKVELADVAAVDVVEINAEQVEVVEVMGEEATGVAALDTIEVASVEQPKVELADVTAVDAVEINAESPLEAVEVIADEATDVAALDTIEVASVEQPKVELADVAVAEEQVDVETPNTLEVAKIELAEPEIQPQDATKIKAIHVPSAMQEAWEKTKQAFLTTLKALDLPAASSTEARQAATPLATEPSALVQDVLPPETDGKAISTQTPEAQRRASTELAMAQSFMSPIHRLVEEGRYRVTGSQTALKHAMRRRWGRQGKQQKQRRWLKIMSAAVIVSILVSLSIPLCVALIGYSTYNNIKSEATDGVNHLLAVKTLIPANKSDLTSVLNPQKLADANTQLSQAQDDFLQLQATINRSDIQSLLQQFAPQYSSKLGMARNLVQVALDVSRMGKEFINIAQWGADTLHGPLISSGTDKPLIDVNNINAIEAALVHGQYYLNDIQTQMAQVDLTQIPFGSTAQKAQLAKALDSLPQAAGLITQAQSMLGPVSWLLGVGQQRHLLVQTLDRGELRPSGGFEGQYGVLTLQDGRMSPFSLTDIAELDYNGSGNELGNHPPAQYKWMDFGNFGVRDANLSADYPTDARMIMQLFQQEGGGPVDGDIQITPVVIAQLLDITGPLYVKDYNETITSQNLEDKIHLYQQNYTYIGKEKQVTGTNAHDTRKAFTSEVGQLLLDRVKHLQVKQLMDLGKVMLTDLKSRDLQIYLNNPVAEQWLVQNDDSGAMPQFTNGTDGFMVVQANISISKAAQYVHSTFHDQVTLDAQGGAYHNLTIALDYQQTGPVYGFNSYADYLRVYAPANARLISAFGFNTGQTLCTPSQGKPPVNPNPNPNPGPNPNPNPNPPGGTTDPTGSYTDAGFAIFGCGGLYNSYPDSGYRSCPNHNYQLGYDGMVSKAWPIQLLGGPSSKSSDLPGYAMWGGMTLTPKNCTSTITLSWYVPNVVQNIPGQPPYQLMVGHQAGWPVTALVNVDTSALLGVQSFTYDQTISEDMLVALPARPIPPTKKSTPPTTPVATPTSTGKER